MRTTLTLDDDVARYLQRIAQETGASFKQVVNDTLRRSIKPKKPLPEDLVPTFSLGLKPGIDPTTIKELDAEEEEYWQARKVALP